MLELEEDEVSVEGGSLEYGGGGGIVLIGPALAPFSCSTSAAAALSAATATPSLPRIDKPEFRTSSVTVGEESIAMTSF